MNINVLATNIYMEDELRAFVQEKLEDSFRAFGDMDLDPVDVQVELKRTTIRHPHELEDRQRFRAEATVFVPGHTIRAQESAQDIRQAIVQLKHTLAREMGVWRERRRDAAREGARELKRMLSGEDEGGT